MTREIFPADGLVSEKRKEVIRRKKKKKIFFSNCKKDWVTSHTKSRRRGR